MKEILLEIVGGLYLGVDVFSLAYAVFLSLMYLGKRSDRNETTYFRWCMMILPLIVLFIELEGKAKMIVGRSVIEIISFAVVSLLGMVTLIMLALHEYNRRKS